MKSDARRLKVCFHAHFSKLRKQSIAKLLEFVQEVRRVGDEHLLFARLRQGLQDHPGIGSFEKAILSLYRSDRT